MVGGGRDGLERQRGGRPRPWGHAGTMTAGDGSSGVAAINVFLQERCR